MRPNVGGTERGLSLAGGGLALAAASRAPATVKLPLTLAGAALLFRGATGYCPINAAVGRDSHRENGNGAWTSAADVVSDRVAARQVHARERSRWHAENDPVDVAAEDSFPASDPPSYTPGHIG
jgi:hypothetical protein